MKIAYYSNVFFSDCDFPLVKEMQNQNVDVTYFVNVYEGRDSGGLFSSISYPRLGIHKANDIPEFRFYRDFIDLDNIYIIIRSKRWYNIVNLWIMIKLFLFLWKKRINVLHLTYELGISEFLLYFYPQSKVMTVHDPFTHSGEGSSYGELKRKFAFRHIDKFVLLNNNQKKTFASLYNVGKRPVLINKLGKYSCLNYVRSIMQMLPNYGKNYILFCGHFSPYKGIDLLCRAMEIVHEQAPEIECIIAGRGVLDFDVKCYDNVGYIKIINKFLSLEELVNLISNSKFVVCPYKDATQSGVVASAFSLNKPVLATNVGGLSETVKDNVNGRLISPNNVEELATAICEMYNSPDKLRLYKDNIEKFFSSGEYSWPVIAQKYIEYYNE
ncbi:Glycosyltransferase involved in cell wall bisynthesis [Prevotella sp. khp1]|uniref:glycosyltransferase family 4 protein n=1 Tax=Prevotellaceae TaxID=171552 RepID=UPI000887CFAB|nr:MULTISPECIES: glycosyltransferase family 4 protein [Prevotellaceae]QVJ81882.1 glycosyltransferase family 4 protein [Xylanibacter ruminicola]SDQ76833.1 Glycosyltransferase involved in cell wall bisynthesis [Prevotella sp. khp1]